MNSEMPVITFSHSYPKLMNECNDIIQTATLLDCTLTELDHLHSAFLAYDTDSGRYPLPKKGQFLKLTFLKPRIGSLASHLFTTLRRYTPQKQRYYADLVGQQFLIRLKVREFPAASRVTR